MFADCSTGSAGGYYYGSKSRAINRFDGVLQAHGFQLDRNDLTDFNGNEGRKIIDVHDECMVIVGRAVLSWFRMESGNYEIIGYLA